MSDFSLADSQQVERDAPGERRDSLKTITENFDYISSLADIIKAYCLSRIRSVEHIEWVSAEIVKRCASIRAEQHKFKSDCMDALYPQRSQPPDPASEAPSQPEKESGGIR